MKAISIWKRTRHATAAAKVSGHNKLALHKSFSSVNQQYGPEQTRNQRANKFSLECYKIIMKGCWLAASIMSLSEDFLRVKLKNISG